MSRGRARPIWRRVVAVISPCRYDPVDLYAALAEVNTMQPLVKDPNVTLEQLYGELSDSVSRARAQVAPGSQEGRSQADELLDTLNDALWEAR